jgi:putative hydrolase of HD superfamily
MTPPPSPAVQALQAAFALKALPRAGWVRTGVPGPESVAAHSWGVALLVLALLPEGLDLRRALTYAVLHDLPEALAGDTTPHDGVSAERKASAEHAAMATLAAGLPRGAALQATWEAYERQDDPEARFVRELDRLDMALQADLYRRGGLDPAQFLDSAARVVRSPELASLVASLRPR